MNYFKTLISSLLSFQFLKFNHLVPRCITQESISGVGAEKKMCLRILFSQVTEERGKIDTDIFLIY